MKKFLQKLKDKFLKAWNEDPFYVCVWIAVILAGILIILMCPAIVMGWSMIPVIIGRFETQMATKNTTEYSPDDSGQGPYSDGSGSSTQSSTQDDKENAALDNLAAIANYNANALRGKRDHGQRVYDIADDQARRLAEAQGWQNKRNTSNDWFTQTKKLQGSANQLKDSAGADISGSNLYQFWDLLESAMGDINAEALNTQRKNQNTINNDLYETISQNVNARNELENDTEYGLHQIKSDYAAQATSVAPDKAKERGIISNGTLGDAGEINPDGYFDARLRGAADINRQGLYTEDDAQRKANELNSKNVANASAANGDYWNRIINGYRKRY